MRKRALDIIVAALALVALSPFLLAMAALVRMSLGRPVFFRQLRIGLNDQSFTMYKFRTMTDARDSAGHPLPDGNRLTRLGRLLRSTSLDELPELLNVLRGDMSLVGPRPLLPRYLPFYTARERLRHSLRPGITGWAQINGRNATTWDQRLALDVWYVEHWSMALDVRILAQTAWTVLTQEGLAADTSLAESALDEERCSLDK